MTVLPKFLTNAARSCIGSFIEHSSLHIRFTKGFPECEKLITDERKQRVKFSAGRMASFQRQARNYTAFNQEKQTVYE